MGSRWAMLGQALGQGANQFIDQRFLQPQAMQNKVNAVSKIDLSGLSPEQLAMLGIKQPSANPFESALAAILMQSMGGRAPQGMQTPGFNPNAQASPAPQVPQSNMPGKVVMPGGQVSGVSNIISQDEQQIQNYKSQLKAGEILVENVKTGEIGAIPEEEFNPNVYQRL